MNTFTINENHWSFKYLHKFSRSFRHAVFTARYQDKYVELPKDFCSYWSKVVKYATFHVSILITLLFELKCTVLFITHFKEWREDELFFKLPWNIRLELLAGSVGAAMLSMILMLLIIICIVKLLCYLSDKILNAASSSNKERIEHIQNKEKSDAICKFRPGVKISDCTSCSS